MTILPNLIIKKKCYVIEMSLKYVIILIFRYYLLFIGKIN